MKQLSKKELEIRKYFNFYQKKVFPLVQKWATQPKEGYHGLETHTDAVVFRAIDYALELGQNPLPVIFAAACHDMARTNDNYNEDHGPMAVPLAKKIMAKFPGKLTEEEQFSVLYAIKNHTIGTQTNDYISACLWDADRTRLAWEWGYHEHYFHTAYAKTIASGDAKKYIARQNRILGRKNKDNEGKQTISLEKDLKNIMQMFERLKTHVKQ